MPFALRHTFPWLLALSLGLFALALPAHASTFAPYFFLSSALLLGVPHGACDPWVPGWVLRHPSRLPFLIIFFNISGYLWFNILNILFMLYMFIMYWC